MYQILFDWKACKNHTETDELPNPKPTQPKTNEVKSGHLGHFFPTANSFSRVGIGFMLETDYKQPNSPKFSVNTQLFRKI